MHINGIFSIFVNEKGIKELKSWRAFLFWTAENIS
jgi:hypothetical protein